MAVMRFLRFPRFIWRALHDDTMGLKENEAYWAFARFATTDATCLDLRKIFDETSRVCTRNGIERESAHNGMLHRPKTPKLPR